MQLNVLEYLEKGALKNFPEKVGLIDGDRSYTFRELAERSKDCARRLMESTCVSRRPVAVFLPKGAATVIADLGILYTGNLYTNFDYNSPVERLKKLLASIDPLLVITNTHLRDSLLTIGMDSDKIFCIEPVLVETPRYDDELLAGRRGEVIDTDPVCIINTSGSTGTPKSVVMHHRSIIDFIDWCLDRFMFGQDEIIGSLSPLYFDIYTLELYVALAKGCTIILIPEQMAAFPARMVNFLEEHQITFVFWVPTVMVNIANLNLLEKAELKSMRKIFFAGEVFPTKHLNYWRRHLHQAEFVNLYGPIEITVDCTYFVVDRDFADHEPIPIGFPCRNSDVLILTDKDLPALDRQQGELCVRGSSLALGYYNNPEQTAKHFTQNPLNRSYPELIYRTGDLVYRNEHGEIMFIGRKDYQIKHLGYRIEMAEIETAVLAIPEIRNACVLYNHSKNQITMFYETVKELSPAVIRTQLSTHLPKYMLPTAFHHLEMMPRNPNGKIDRNSLSVQFQLTTSSGETV